MGFGKDIGNTIGGIIGAKKARDETAKERRRRMAMLEGMDKQGAFEPMYASERAPTFQRSQSPVARAYLESMLMGNNPDSTFSGEVNADVTKQQQQASRDQVFGTPEQLKAKQDELFAQTPWKVTPPNKPMPGEELLPPEQRTVQPRPVGGNGQGVAFAAKNPLSTSMGFSPEMMNALDQQKLGGNEFSLADFFASGEGTQMGSYLSEKDQRRNDRKILPKNRKKGNNLQDEVEQFVTLYQQDPNAALQFFNSSDLGKKYQQAAKQATGKAAGRYKEG